jgi:RNA polymerase sigma factor (sigma-70 family)
LLAALIRFLMKMGVPDADAEEIASDVFMQVQKSIGSFTPAPQARLTTWIFEIAKNRAIDYHRASKRAAEQLQAYAEEVSRQSGQPFAGKNEEAVQWLLDRLSAMDEGERNILLWRAQDFSYDEIAKWLGITEGAARVRHKRALDKLKAEGQKGAGQNE